MASRPARPDIFDSPRSISTGIDGLDDILGGGLPRNRIHLVEGDPGTGKTTLALQFLLEGVRLGEAGLYVTLSETKEELIAVARSHGWSLDALTICELTVPEDTLKPESQYTLFHPSEVELGETTKSVLDEVERVQPVRLVFDSLSEMRLLARDPLRFRRQILALKQFFIGRQCTVVLLDDRASEVTSLATGVIVLEHLAPIYGAERRRLRVQKMRGTKFRGGYHDFMIRTGGLQIFPRLVAAEHRHTLAPSPLSSGIPALDALLGGGLDRGTSTLLMGPAGVGKSSVASHYAAAAADRGERAAMFIFDESRAVLLARARGLGMSLADHVESGRIVLRQVDPAELSPGEFVSTVREVVEHDKPSVVVIDSLNGYLNAMPEEQFLTLQLHELLAYLAHHEIVTIFVVAQHGLVGTGMQTVVDVSYLADSVLIFRYFEAEGTVRQAMSVLKKRTGHHERTIRELFLTPGVIKVGAPLHDFEGVLTGVPRQRGNGSRAATHD
jgi:circadian clock protein KaiC